jgi:ABC transporter with metal-binding/Fe-S-binding domain ATP-binding protein
MDVASLFSGAKDSTFAIYKAMHIGLSVKYLVTMLPETSESYMFHKPEIELVKIQSESLGIPLITKETSEGNELKDLKDVLSSIKSEIQGVVTGTLENRYQRLRIEKACGELGLKCFFPSWQRNMNQYWEEILLSGFKVIITSVSSEGFNEEWLGKEIDKQTLKELKKISEKHGIHFGGEGGCYRTFVLDAPIFNKRVRIIKAERHWDGVDGVYVIKDARLNDK